MFKQSFIILCCFFLSVSCLFAQQSPSSVEQAKWVWSLGESKNLQSIGDIYQAIHDESWMVRCSAINALANFANFDDTTMVVIPTLSKEPQPINTIIRETITRCLLDENKYVRVSSARQISKFPLAMPVAILLLQRMLQNPKEDEIVKVAATESLGSFADVSSLPFLKEAWLKVYRSPNAGLNQAIENTLSQIICYYGQAVAPILNDPQQPPEWRKQIILSTGRLLFLLQEKEDEKNIARLKFQQTIQHFLPILSNISLSPSPTSELQELRASAMMLYTDLLGNQAIPILQVCLNDRSIPVQQIAILGLGRLQHEASIPSFFSKSLSLSPPIVEASLWAITQFPLPIVQENILRFVQGKREDEQNIGIRLVAHFKILEAIPAILELYHTNSKLHPKIIGTFEILLPLLSSEHPNFKEIKDIWDSYTKKHSQSSNHF